MSIILRVFHSACAHRPAQKLLARTTLAYPRYTVFPSSLTLSEQGALSYIRGLRPAIPTTV